MNYKVILTHAVSSNLAITSYFTFKLQELIWSIELLINKNFSFLSIFFSSRLRCLHAKIPLSHHSPLTEIYAELSEMKEFIFWLRVEGWRPGVGVRSSWSVVSWCGGLVCVVEFILSLFISIPLHIDQTAFVSGPPPFLSITQVQLRMRIGLYLCSSVCVLLTRAFMYVQFSTEAWILGEYRKAYS